MTTAIIWEEEFDTAITYEVAGEDVKHQLFEPGTLVEWAAATTLDDTSVSGHAQILMVAIPT